MKLVHTDLESQFIFDGNINILVVESGKVFREYCDDIRLQTEGETGQFTLSDGDAVLNFAKYACFIPEYFTLDICDKKTINKLYANLSGIIDEKFNNEASLLSEKIFELFDKINSESDVPVEYDVSSPFESILKAFGVRPQNDFTTFIEKLENYLNALVCLGGIKLFFFVNLRCFLSDIEYSEFCKYVRLSEINVFLLESSEKSKSEGEFIVIIDEDLCETVV